MILCQFEDICKKYGLEICRSNFDKDADCWYNNSLICYFISAQYTAYVVKDLHLAGRKYNKFIYGDNKSCMYKTPEKFELKLQEVIKKWKQLEIEIAKNNLEKDFDND